MPVLCSDLQKRMKDIVSAFECQPSRINQSTIKDLLAEYFNYVDNNSFVSYELIAVIIGSLSYIRYCQETKQMSGEDISGDVPDYLSQFDPGKRYKYPLDTIE